MRKNWRLTVVEHAISLMEGGFQPLYSATDAKGNICSLDSPDAKMFSVSGALERALRDQDVPPKEHNSFLEEMVGKVGHAVYRENATAAGAIAACKRAIAIISRERAKAQSDQEREEALQRGE